MSFLNVDFSGLGLISNCCCLDGECAFGDVSHHVMSCALGRYAYGRSLEYDYYIWKVFACVLVDYVSMDVCIRILRLGGQHHAQCRHQS